MPYTDVEFPPKMVPAVTILPSDWIATPNDRPPVRLNCVVTDPPVPNVPSRVPFGFSRATADTPSMFPLTTLLPSVWRARSQTSLYDPGPMSRTSLPPVPKVPSRVPSGLYRARIQSKLGPFHPVPATT